MKARIKKIIETGSQLRVIVEHEYGVDNFGISERKKEFNHLTGEPKWIDSVKKLLRKKYKNAKPINQQDYVGKEIDLDK